MYSHCRKNLAVCIYAKIFILINIISVLWNRVLIKE